MNGMVATATEKNVVSWSKENGRAVSLENGRKDLSVSRGKHFILNVTKLLRWMLFAPTQINFRPQVSKRENEIGQEETAGDRLGNEDPVPWLWSEFPFGKTMESEIYCAWRVGV
jgi:hypothetical protein